ncbi:MAG TPA: hypothetical protein VGP41_15045 [Candidatus Lustribacter sp.]|nr:hypothetical protein [Candidatus Lustribacter sp.]
MLDIDACPGLAGQPSTRRDLISEYISIPSLAHPAGTPAVLDRVQFVRIRERSADPHKVDAVLLQAIPNGGGGISEMGTQVVETAARAHKNFELWIIERRERNLEDLTGMREAFSRGDPDAALHYYYGDHWTGANGKFNGTFGGPGAKFVPLTQNDVPFLADWDASVMFGDVESIMDLVPQRKTHLFAYSAAPGGGFLSQLAGVKLHDGKRGYQELAGLIPIEGQLSYASVGTGEPAQADIEKYIAAVQAIRSGKTPRFLDNDYTTAISPGPNVQVTNSLVTLFALFRPNAESMFAIAPGAVGGAPADAFTAKLRLTNRARLGFAISSDPIPGSFTTIWINSWFGGRIGRLDYTPVAGSAACAVAGPFGLQAPCVPPVAQIDPAKVYGWLDGGGGPGTHASALEGWTIFKGRFDGSAVRGEFNPTRLATIAESVGRPATRTNLTPLTIDFPTGRRTIDASFGYFFAWYASNRYHSIDIPFLNTYRKILIDRPDLDIHLDFDKTHVDIPVLAYTVHAGSTNPFGGADYTAVEQGGLAIETPLAKRLSPMNPAASLRLYNNLDVHTAENARGALVAQGKLAPGDVGAHAISTTIVPWILARAAKTPIDLSGLPQTHVSCSRN